MPATVGGRQFLELHQAIECHVVSVAETSRAADEIPQRNLVVGKI